MLCALSLRASSLNVKETMYFKLTRVLQLKLLFTATLHCAMTSKWVNICTHRPYIHFVLLLVSGLKVLEILQLVAPPRPLFAAFKSN
jgi:hypothetical protein